jgi:chorismate mutase
MEDSIIFSLIERSQFKTNSSVYDQDCSQLGEFKLHQLKCAGSNGCLGDWFIYQTECLHSQVRRYKHPTEFPFFGPLPSASMGSTSGGRTDNDAVLASVPAEAIVNQRLLEIYRTKMVPALCEEGDDGNHGSTAVQDVHCLQTMATRIYYGLFVAESKFRSEREKAEALIRARDREGLMAFITKPEVEARNIRRVILKARTFSQNIEAPGEAGQLTPTQENATYKINPDYIGTVFRDFLMPLTRDVEVEYLLARLSVPDPATGGLKRPLEDPTESAARR